MNFDNFNRSGYMDLVQFFNQQAYHYGTYDPEEHVKCGCSGSESAYPNIKPHASPRTKRIMNIVRGNIKRKSSPKMRMVARNIRDLIFLRCNNWEPMVLDYTIKEQIQEVVSNKIRYKKTHTPKTRVPIPHPQDPDAFSRYIHARFVEIEIKRRNLMEVCNE